MARRSINRLHIFVPNTIISADAHNEEHDLFTSAINDIYSNFEFVNGKLHFPATQVRFESFSTLDLESFLRVAHNPDGSLKLDALGGYPPSRTPAPNSIPVSLGNAKIDVNWLPLGHGGGLNADMLDGAHASVTPGAGAIPIARSNGKIDTGWLPASATPTPNTIPVAGSNGKIDTGWLPATVNYSYSRLTVGASLPSSGNENALFYRTTDNKLFVFRRGNWEEIDWTPFVQASPEWIAGRLRIQNGQLQISPNGTNWFNCIPAVSANTIELTSVDNTNYTILYWIPPGVTIIIRNSNHLPIVYTPTSEPMFIGMYRNNEAYEYWLGLRPSNASIPNGYGQWFSAWGANNVAAGYANNLTIVPITEQASSSTEYWTTFSLHITNNQRWLVAGIGQGSEDGIHIFTGSGVAPASAYWLGTWYRQDGARFTMTRIVLTRLA